MGGFNPFKMKKAGLTVFLLIVLISSQVALISGQEIPISSGERGENQVYDSNSLESIVYSAGIGVAGTPTVTPLIFDSDSDGVEDVIVVGTDEGVSLLDYKTGSITMNYKMPGSVSDIAELDDVNNYGAVIDIVVSSTSQKEPNVQCFEPETGKTIWSFKPTIETYGEDEEFPEEKEPITWSIETVTDVTNDGKKDVVIASWYMVYLLDGATGEEKWMWEEAEDDCWSIKALGDNALVVTSQDGYLYSIDLSTGETKWSFEARKTEKISGDEIINETASFWNVEVVYRGGGQTDPVIVAAADDGYVYFLEENGNLITDVSIIPSPEATEETEGYEPRLLVFPLQSDFDNDGLNDIAARSFLARNNKAAILSSNGQTIASGEIREIGDGVNLGSFTNTIGEKLLLWPYGGQGDYEQINIYKVQTGVGGEPELEENTTISFQTRPSSWWYGEDEAVYINVINDTQALLVCDTGAFLINPQSNVIIWSNIKENKVQTMLMGDVTGDGVSELLVTTKSRIEWEEWQNITRTILVINGANGQVIWSNTTNHDLYLQTGGYWSVTPTPDVTGDGNPDITAYIKEWPRGGGFPINDTVYVFNGATGEVVWSEPVIFPPYSSNDEIRSSCVVEDLNADNFADILVSGSSTWWYGGGETSYIYLFSGENGLLLSNKTFTSENNRGIYLYSLDKVSDGSLDLLLVEWSDWWPYTAKIHAANDLTPTSFWANNSANFTDDTTIDWTTDLQNLVWTVLGSDYYIELGRDPSMYILFTQDLGVDGIKDLAIRADSPTNRGYVFISSSTGTNTGLQVTKVTWSQEAFWGFDFDLVVDDLTGDGFPDSIVYHRWYYGDIPPYLTVIDGFSNEEITVYQFDRSWSYEGRDSDQYLKILPATVISDKDGDGIKDLVIGVSQSYYQGAEIKVFSLEGGTDKEISTTTIEKLFKPSWERSPEYSAVYSVINIGDVSGSSSDEIAIVRPYIPVTTDDHTDIEDTKRMTEIVDTNSLDVVKSFPIETSDLINIGDVNGDTDPEILLSSAKGMFCLNSAFQVTITTPTDGKSVGSKFNLEWTFNSEGADTSALITEVFVDDVSHGSTSKKNMEVEIGSGGEHVVKVKTRDPFGGVTASTISIKTPGSILMLIITIGVIVIFSLLLLVKKQLLLKKRKTKLEKRS